MHHYYWDFERVKYIRGQAIFTDKDPVENAYIVCKGEFEMQKRLPKQMPLKAVHAGGKGANLTKQQISRNQKMLASQEKNLYQRKFPDMKDFPYS